MNPWIWVAGGAGAILAAKLLAPTEGDVPAAWATSADEKEPPPDTVGAVDTDPPAVPSKAPLAPPGATVLLLGDELVYDLYPSMEVAAAAHQWSLSLLSVKGATVATLAKALSEMKIPAFDVAIVSIGTNDARGDGHPALEAPELLQVALKVGSTARRGVVWLIPPSFHRYLLFPDIAEKEMYEMLRGIVAPDSAFGPKAQQFAIYPSWRSVKPDVTSTGGLTPEGAQLVVSELVEQLVAS